MRIDRRLIKNFDWITLALVTLLSLMGILTIYSATRSPLPGGEMPSFYVKQLYWLLVSVAAMIAIVSFDYIWLKRFSYVLYGLGIFLLLLVFFHGRTGMGAQRWLNIGIFSFQPSEVFKLFYVITISRYLSETQGKAGLISLLKAFLLLAYLGGAFVCIAALCLFLRFVFVKPVGIPCNTAIHEGTVRFDRIRSLFVYLDVHLVSDKETLLLATDRPRSHGPFPLDYFRNVPQGSPVRAEFCANGPVRLIANGNEIWVFTQGDAEVANSRARTLTGEFALGGLLAFFSARLLLRRLA